MKLQSLAIAILPFSALLCLAQTPEKPASRLDAVNGHTPTGSVTDGYTQVQINLPPEKTKSMDLYVVTCAYNGNEKRSYGWQPPEAVMKELKGK